MSQRVIALQFNSKIYSLDIGKDDSQVIVAGGASGHVRLWVC